MSSQRGPLEGEEDHCSRKKKVGFQKGASPRGSIAVYGCPLGCLWGCPQCVGPFWFLTYGFVWSIVVTFSDVGVFVSVSVSASAFDVFYVFLLWTILVCGVDGSGGLNCSTWQYCDYNQAIWAQVYWVF